MGKIKRGGYVFITRMGDHDLRHAHIFKDGEQIGRWDLENNQAMEGKISPKIRHIIQELREEGKL